MTSEFTPTGSNPRMTKAQVRKYIATMQAAQAAAKEKLEKEAGKEEREKKKELSQIEKELENLL